MVGKFYKNENSFYFVVSPSDWEQTKFHCFKCDSFCVHIEPCIVEVVNIGNEIEWNKVPRSFLAFCFARAPRSFEGVQ